MNDNKCSDIVSNMIQPIKLDSTKKLLFVFWAPIQRFFISKCLRLNSFVTYIAAL